jgi:hypothetical protein
MRRRIVIRQTAREDMKLGLVKHIKDISGLGLKESKDKADLMCDNFNSGRPSSMEIFSDLHPIDLNNLISSLLQNTSGKYIIDNIESDREKKILSLGIGSNEDFVNFISTEISYRPTEYVQNHINYILSKLNREQLEDVFSKVTEDIEFPNNIK